MKRFFMCVLGLILMCLMTPQAFAGCSLESFATLEERAFLGIAYGFDFLWAVHKSAAGGDFMRIAKIDPDSGVIVQESSTLPWNGRGITVAFGSLWVADTSSDVVRQVDPSSFSVISSFGTPSGEPNGLAFDGNNLWLIDPASQKVFELTTSGVVLSSFSFLSVEHNGLEWENGGLWTNTSPTEFSHYLTDGTIDETRAFEGLPPGRKVRDITFAGGRTFITSGDTVWVEKCKGISLDIKAVPNPAIAGSPFEILLDLENLGDGFNANFGLWVLVNNNVTRLVNLSPFVPPDFGLFSFPIFSTLSFPAGLPPTIGFLATIFNAASGELLDWDFESVGIGVAPSTADINALRHTVTDFLDSGGVSAAPVRPTQELSFNGKVNNPFEPRTNSKEKLTTTWGRIKSQR